MCSPVIAACARVLLTVLPLVVGQVPCMYSTTAVRLFPVYPSFPSFLCVLGAHYFVCQSGHLFGGGIYRLPVVACVPDDSSVFLVIFGNVVASSDHACNLLFHLM
jgi:hypothetical protein